MDVGAEQPAEIGYSLGIDNKDLKRFSVFDAKSVLIHLDQSNSINFTPAQIRLFDKVADTISKLERKLDLEKHAKRKDNPFAAMFFDQNEVSSIADFCRSITSSTKDEDFLNHAYFDPETDEAKIKELEIQINEKRKLDIPNKKSQLTTDRENLGALKKHLQSIIGHFTQERMQETNKLVDDILEKKRLVEELSVKKFDDGLFKTIGSAEWKSLIAAAKVLYESEKTANKGEDPVYCMLCHQGLRQTEKTLFENYWRFLESQAETELSGLSQKKTKLLETLQHATTTFPQFLITDAGIKVLTDNDPAYLAGLKANFAELSSVLEDWIQKISQPQKIDRENVPTIDLTKIDTLVTAKAREESNLRDPSSAIADLAAQLKCLKHKKAVTAVKESALQYISFLRWLSKTDVVSFAGIKGALTKKRTEAFQSGVLSNYFGIFSQELQALGCAFDLTLSISGDQGNTVREYKFEFAEAYNPSQILSEGEQNACSLADFLTEIQIDKNNCGIIFDDPVTSLDHERKDKIAKRLVSEAANRQVIIFTHDIVFMSQLVKHAADQTPFVAHWMRNVNGTPGYVEENTSPKLASLNSLKNDSQNAVAGFETLSAKEQEHALGLAFDYLRSACEALIEEKLFAETIQRYDDYIRVQNLEEVVFDQAIALKIVELHGKISEVLLAHNRSDLRRENQSSLADLKKLREEFDDLEKKITDCVKAARKARQDRKAARVGKKAGW